MRNGMLRLQRVFFIPPALPRHRPKPCHHSNNIVAHLGADGSVVLDARVGPGRGARAEQEQEHEHGSPKAALRLKALTNHTGALAQLLAVRHLISEAGKHMTLCMLMRHLENKSEKQMIV